MAKKIFLVEEQQSFFTIPKKAFYNKTDAEKYISTLKEQQTPVFNLEIWSIIESEYNDAVFNNPGIYDSKTHNSYEHEQIKKEFLLNCLHSHGFDDAIMEDVDKQLKIIDKCDDYLDYTIIEINLE